MSVSYGVVSPNKCHKKAQFSQISRTVSILSHITPNRADFLFKTVCENRCGQSNVMSLHITDVLRNKLMVCK